jgi:S1-C subfamily serine protease
VLRPYLGATLGDITPDADCELCLSRRIGTLITSVESNGPAELAGLQKDDIIIKFGDQEIISTVSLINELWSYSAGDTVNVIFWRNEKEMTTSITLIERPN